MVIPSTKTLMLEIPISAFCTFKQTTEEFARSLRLAAAVNWYERGILSQERAAEIAGLSREDFLMALLQFEVSPFQYSAEDILKEAGYDTSLGN
jgi:predicted HTH domain antitoxin